MVWAGSLCVQGEFCCFNLGGCRLIRLSQITGLLSYHRSLPIRPPLHTRGILSF
nr:MAG TPA: hypothetical protein [Caudoviricetes sp.]